VYCYGINVESGGYTYSYLYEGVYEIIFRTSDGYFMLKDKPGIYDEKAFITLKEYRKIKLQKICSNQEIK
jgi:hypothetical protein